MRFRQFGKEQHIVGSLRRIGIVHSNGTTPVYFTARSNGQDVRVLLAEGLARANNEGRLADEPHTTRIVFDTLTELTGDSTGCGIHIGELPRVNVNHIPTVCWEGRGSEPVVFYGNRRYTATDFIRSVVAGVPLTGGKSIGARDGVMTKIRYSYRPFSPSLTIWNDDIENELYADDYDLLDTVYIDAPKDGEWHINISTLNKDGVDYFHGMEVLDAFGRGVGWNLYLSIYLPDSVIEQIYASVSRWNKLPMSDDLRERVATTYFESLEINSDCSLPLSPGS